MRHQSTVRGLIAVVTAAVAVVSAASTAAAQAVAEDSKGTSTILIKDVDISINTSDSSIQIGGSSFTSTRPAFFSVQAKGKAANGIATLIADGHLEPGAELSLVMGRKFGGERSIGTRLEGGGSRFAFYDSAAAPENAITKSTLSTGEVGVFFNSVLKSKNSRFGFLGIGMAGRRVNNAEELDKIKITRRKVATVTNGFETQEAATETEARVGLLREGWIASIDADAIFHNWEFPVSMRPYVRLGVSGPDELREQRFGFDLAFFKPRRDPLFDRLGSVFVELTRPGVSGGKTSLRVGLAVALPLVKTAP